jgi:hypothetical protein
MLFERFAEKLRSGRDPLGVSNFAGSVDEERRANHAPNQNETRRPR